jgi:hypothetical protein
VAVTGQGSPEQVHALDVTDGLLPILGVTPMLDRWFNRVDAGPGAADTVMLDYGYWQRRFGAGRAIVGRTITLDGQARQVIGVSPQQFRFLDGEQPALFLPIQFDRNRCDPTLSFPQNALQSLRVFSPWFRAKGKLRS